MYMCIYVCIWGGGSVQMYGYIIGMTGISTYFPWEITEQIGQDLSLSVKVCGK